LAIKATAKSAKIQTMNEITPKRAKTVNSSRRAIAIMPILFFLRRNLSGAKLVAAGITITLNSISKVLKYSIYSGQ
jgi:hypothetical protein